MKKLLLLFVFFSCLEIALLVGNEGSTSPKPKIIPVTTEEPEEGVVYPIAVIGAGAGGTMAAQRAILNNKEVLLFTGAKHELKNSRGMWVRKVENIPGLESYSRTVVELRDEMLKKVTEGPFSKNFFVIKDSVVKMEKQGDIFCLTDGQGKNYLVRYVILATGMMDVQPKIDGEIEPILYYANKQHIAYCLMCDGHRSFEKRTIVIGHEEGAAKAALLLWKRYHPLSVTVVTNGERSRFSKQLRQELADKGIAVLEERIKEFLGDKELNEFYGVRLETQEIAADIGFVALGIRPNNELAKMMGAALDERGLVVANSEGETTVKNMYVIGDVRANSMKQIYTAWQHAVEAVASIERKQ